MLLGFLAGLWILRARSVQAARSGAAGEANSPTRLYRRYAVNSESPLCSQVGARILEAGGNALDAAVATNVCIGVVNSFSSGIGGGGFLLLHKKAPAGDTVDMFDFRETAPGGIDIAALQRSSNASKVGGMAVATPGEVLGMYRAHEEYGRLPWKRLFEENIAIARGFRASRLLAAKLKSSESYILADEGLRSVYTANGRLLEAGDLVVRSNYAATLEALADSPLSFYRGELADGIVAAVRSRGGALSRADLAGYAVKKRDVLLGRYHDYRVYTTSLPTSGALLIEALKILENLDFGELRAMDRTGRMHIFYSFLIETFKFITVKRGELGDPDFIRDYRTLLSVLISDDYARDIYKKIRIASSLATKDYGPVLPFAEDHGTTHLNVVDADGMIVQITSTINLEFGAKFMDPRTGIVFNNQIDDFYIPNIENAYALQPMLGNIIERGKRPFSSAAPAILLRDGEAIAIGATGGTRIPTAILGTLGYMFMGLDVSRAVSSVRIHNQFSPDITYVEPSFPRDVWARLESAGERLEISDVNSIFTSVQVLQITQDGDGSRLIRAVSDPRKHGGSAGA